MKFQTACAALVLPASIVSACAAGADDGAPDDVAAIDTAGVELEIGALEGDGPDVFGRLASVGLDERGRIYAVDMQADEVRVFDDGGAFLFAIGRSGQGPGELESPCCIGFAPDGSCWIRNNGNSRYEVFDLAGDSVRYLRSVRMAHADANRWAPVTFDPAGWLIDIGYRSTAGSDELRTYRLHLDSAGRVVEDVAVHAAPDDSTGVHKVDVKRGDVVAVRYMYQPFGPRELIAHSPDGGYAYALSSRFAVAWYDDDGTVVRHFTDNGGSPPTLSAAERDRAEEDITRQARFASISRAAVPFGVPDHKQPLRDLFFDAAGNLWVELSVPEGEPRRARVYGSDGTLLREAVWPADVELSWGTIRDDVAVGIARDSLDVQRIVRLRFRRGPASATK